MLTKQLQKITLEQKQLNNTNNYVKNILKEYLQVYVLNYIYNNKEYSNNFIFTGGTCLRHCYQLPRLSEDIDLDYVDEFNVEELSDGLQKYFESNFNFKDLDLSIKQKGRQLLLKFPILHSLKLATKSESDLLYVKIDVTQIYSETYKTLKTPKNMFGFNYIVYHYDLPSLMSGKIAAILTRQRLIGKQDTPTIKGRDYFDLLWYLDPERKIVPNWTRINELVDKNYSKEQIVKLIDEKVVIATTKYKQDFLRDLLPFIDNQEFTKAYVDTFAENYKRYREYLLKYTQ